MYHAASSGLPPGKTVSRGLALPGRIPTPIVPATRCCRRGICEMSATAVKERAHILRFLSLGRPKAHDA